MIITLTTYRFESKFHLLTTEIQSAMDNVSKAGGGKVVLTPGTYRCGTLFLRNNVDFHLQKGAIIVGSSCLDDYPIPDEVFIDAIGDTRGRALLIADKVNNIILSGEGVIDGNGGSFAPDSSSYGERPFILRVNKCKKIRISQLSFRNSAAWTIHLLLSQQIHIESLDIDSRINENNDGIDIDSCSNVKIKNCIIASDDDAICLKSTSSDPCENVKVSHCTLTTECSALKIGTESYGDIRDVEISDITVLYAATGAIKVLSSDGAIIENVIFRNISILYATGPIFIRLGERSRTYNEGDHPKKAGAIRNIYFEKITATIFVPPKDIENPFTKEIMPARSFSGIFITGFPEHYIENILFEKMDIKFYGGGCEQDITRTLPQHIEMYPELFYFGPLPSYGVYIRHAKGITFSKFKPSLLNNDCRPLYKEHDSQNIEWIKG